MYKTKVLGIAPYESLATLMRQVASQRDDIECTVFVGDLEAGARIAKQHEFSGFDVILSRGGTAERIRSQGTLPVVDIQLSVYDILRSLKIAENYNNKYAIIGFPAITKNTHFLCEIMRYNLDIFTIHDEDEAHSTLQSLSKNGYNMVLCDMITNSLARTYGLTSLLITSGSESIGSAFDQAVQTNHTTMQLAKKINFYRTVLESQQKQIFVYNSLHDLVYSSKNDQIPAAITDKLVATIDTIARDGEKKMYFETAGKLCVVTGLCKVIDDELFVLYYFSQRKMPIPADKHGIVYANKEEVVDQFFNSFYGMTRASADNMPPEQYAQSQTPVLILGEVGTGKDQMVNLLYTNSNLCNAPLTTIDCVKLNQAGWKFLTENENSPLSDTNATIHFKHLKALSDQQFLELTLQVKDMRVDRRNKLLFTSTYDEREGMNSRCRHIAELFGCTILMLPALRTHKNEIASVASLYLSILNMQTAKELVGFEPKAIELIEQFDWPGNYDQFRRIVGELVSITHTPYVMHSTVKQLLDREAALYRGKPAVNGCDIDLSHSLDEINLVILQLVLQEERGNQSAAAKRLGISRTTFWRMMQKLGSNANEPTTQ